jgi:hypothetical protein
MYSSIIVIVHKVEKKEFRDTGDGELVQTFSAPCLQEDDRVGRTLSSEDSILRTRGFL